MSGITACPQCQTRFRVTTEQLQARSGEVRCGRCQHIFNAYQMWEEETHDEQDESSPQIVKHRLAMPVSREKRDEDSPSEFHAEVVAEVTHESAAIEAHQDEAAVEAPFEAMPVESGAEEAQLEAPSEIEPNPAPSEASVLPDTGGLEEISEESLESEAPFCALPESEVRVVRVQPSVERTQPRVSPSMPRYAPPPKPGLVWPLVLLNLMLGMTLLGQGAYFYRDWIVAQYPVSKPLMESACEILQCRIALLKNLDLLGIESSDLHSDPDRSSLVTLTSVLRNRASHVQAFPALELTLTNARDEVLVRRLFAPKEYLPPASNIDQGIPAKGEVAVKLLLEMGEVKADGYRLYLL
jgi:predicted Zn finger-like uncharacterized protein